MNLNKSTVNRVGHTFKFSKSLLVLLVLLEMPVLSHLLSSHHQIVDLFGQARQHYSSVVSSVSRGSCAGHCRRRFDSSISLLSSCVSTSVLCATWLASCDAYLGMLPPAHPTGRSWHSAFAHCPSFCSGSW